MTTSDTGPPMVGISDANAAPTDAMAMSIQEKLVLNNLRPNGTIKALTTRYTNATVIGFIGLPASAARILVRGCVRFDVDRKPAARFDEHGAGSTESKSCCGVP